MLPSPTLSAYGTSFLLLCAPPVTLSFTFRSHSESMLSLPFFPLIDLYLSSFFPLLTSFFQLYCLLVFFLQFFFLARFFPFILLFYNLLSLFPTCSLSQYLPPVPSSSSLDSTYSLLTSSVSYLRHSVLNLLSDYFCLHRIFPNSLTPPPPPYCLVAGVLDEL